MKPGRRKFLKAMGSSAASVVTSSIALAEESKSQPAGESHCAEKPAAIISGQSQAEGIAKFASRVTYDDLTPERRERLKISILDSLACAINAVGAPPIAACLAQAKEFGGPNGRCTLIGAGKADVVYAASYNTALVRYLDFMDSYLAGAELCHPSDNMGSVLAACEHTRRSGKEFLTALAVGAAVVHEFQGLTAVASATMENTISEPPQRLRGACRQTPFPPRSGAWPSRASGSSR
jgi:2-methylcitrate dehydratase